MEIDCPSQAVAIWTEGDKILIRFPDRQLIDIPITSPMIKLLHILQPREKAQRALVQMSVGTKMAPVQYDIDAISVAINGNPYAPGHELEAEEAYLKKLEKVEQKKRRLLREDAKRQARREADELLALCGL